MLKKLGLGSLALVATLVASVAVAGLWNNFPKVGGARYCITTVNGVCQQYVPAGPTTLTGNETVPLDTNLGSGANPQTVIANIGKLGAGKTTYNTPVTTDSITIDAQTRQLIVTPAGTIAAMTLVFPTATLLAEADGQRFGFCTTQIITTLTVTAGSGTTVSNAPSAMLVPVATGGASCVEWIYSLSNTTWYRVQ